MQEGLRHRQIEEDIGDTEIETRVNRQSRPMERDKKNANIERAVEVGAAKGCSVLLLLG